MNPGWGGSSEVGASMPEVLIFSYHVILWAPPGITSWVTTPLSSSSMALMSSLSNETTEPVATAEYYLYMHHLHKR